MLKQLINEALLSLTITTTGPVLVRSGHATLSGPDMTPVLTYRDGNWQVYLPGSSLKGVFRSHLEKIGRTLNQNNAICNPFHRHPESDEFCGSRLQRRKDSGKSIDSQIAYRVSCPICRLFGSTEFIGRISVNDAYLVDFNAQNPVESRHGVGIDRLTGGAFRSALFDLEVVSSGVAFQTEIYLRNFEIWQLGMVLLLVQDMQDGLIRIGSGRSRGLGSVKGATDAVTINHIGSSATYPAHEVWGLGKFLQEEYGTSPDDMLSLDAFPERKQRGLRMQAEFRDDNLKHLSDQAIKTCVERLQAWRLCEMLQEGAHG